MPSHPAASCPECEDNNIWQIDEDEGVSYRRVRFECIGCGNRWWVMAA